MGRTSRLVNPDDGPLQSFAHDLRKLREKAGNPTYRALAKTAGFSASTLGEAAGGVRKPSLDVTLAFAGACGGDIEAWQERWQQLDEQLSAGAGQVRVEHAEAGQHSAEPVGTEQDGTGQDGAGQEATTPGPTTDPTVDPVLSPRDDLATNPAESAPDATDSPSPAPEAPAPELASATATATPKRPRIRRSLLIPALAVAVVSALVFGVTSHDPKRTNTPVAGSGSKSAAATTATPTANATASACPAASAKGMFGGSTRGSGARVRAGASMADTVIRTVAANCALQFAGYCLGDVVPDPLGGTPDMRWFEVVGGGVVSSAVVHGNPPAAMEPTACADSVPLPSAVSLSVTTTAGSPDTFELRATGTQVWIVGYATVPSVRTGGTISASSQWQQIGMVSIATAGTALAWSARPSGSGSGTAAASLPIVAVACFGGQGPTDVMDAESVSVTDPSSTTPLALTRVERVAAANAACSYPRP